MIAEAVYRERYLGCNQGLREIPLKYGQTVRVIREVKLKVTNVILVKEKSFFKRRIAISFKDKERVKGIKSEGERKGKEACIRRRN